jgi:hypothetical protein
MYGIDITNCCQELIKLTGMSSELVTTIYTCFAGGGLEHACDCFLLLKLLLSLLPFVWFIQFSVLLGRVYSFSHWLISLCLIWYLFLTLLLGCLSLRFRLTSIMGIEKFSVSCRYWFASLPVLILPIKKALHICLVRHFPSGAVVHFM